MRQVTFVSALPSDALLDRTRKLAADERHSTVELIEALAEVLTRQLYRAEGFSSMFAFCTRSLFMSESCAYDRIEAARALRVFPAIAAFLRDGSLNLTNLRLLIPVLTVENHVAVLESARGCTKEQVLTIVATLRPKPDVPSTVRKLPEPVSSERSAPQILPNHADGLFVSGRETATVRSPVPRSHRAVVAPLAPARFRIQCTIDEDTQACLRRLQSLMRHQIPNGDLAAILKKALALLLEDVEQKKFGAVAHPRPPSSRPSPGSRTIPRHVRRAVAARDGERCAFIGSQGRCGSRDHLEFHHVVPFARGGAPTVDNIELRCRVHNQFEAEREFGRDFMSRATS